MHTVHALAPHTLPRYELAEVYFRNTGKRMYGWPGVLPLPPYPKPPHNPHMPSPPTLPQV